MGTGALAPQHMAQTIRIKKSGPRALCFVVESSAGNPIATSVAFDTMCRLETGLATVTAAAQSAQSAVVERDARTTAIGLGARRSGVRFVGDLSDDEVRDLVSGAGTAKVVDERPAGQRSANLTGRLCDLGH